MRHYKLTSLGVVDEAAALRMAEAREFVATLASLAGLKATAGQGQSN